MELIELVARIIGLLSFLGFCLLTTYRVSEQAKSISELRSRVISLEKVLDYSPNESEDGEDDTDRRLD